MLRVFSDVDFDLVEELRVSTNATARLVKTLLAQGEARLGSPKSRLGYISSNYVSKSGWLSIIHHNLRTR